MNFILAPPIYTIKCGREEGISYLFDRWSFCSTFVYLNNKWYIDTTIDA